MKKHIIKLMSFINWYRGELSVKLNGTIVENNKVVATFNKQEVKLFEDITKPDENGVEIPFSRIYEP